MIVQIYEIQTPEEAEKCADIGVDHIGSVLLDKDGWKNRALKDVVSASKAAGAKHSMIPLFTDLDTLCRTVDFYRSDFIHFCDNLTDKNGNALNVGRLVELQENIKSRFPEIGIIRSIPVPARNYSGDFPAVELARKFEHVSDYFLIDTWVGDEAEKGFVGITGRAVDWDMSSELIRESKIPVILAGGLSPDNVYDAMIKTAAFGADSCTLTNAVDNAGRPIRFKKDFEKVALFVKEVRRAEAIRRSSP